MKNKSAAWLLAAIGLASTASAQPYSDLFVFGDSLSDSGNIAAMFGTNPGQVITDNTYIPTLPYASGNYTNDTTWAQRFAGMTGLGSAPSEGPGGGTNYAVGGAQTSAGAFSLNMQMGDFLSDYSNVAPSNALYVVAGGGNNARSTLEAIAGGAPIPQAIYAAATQYAFDIGNIVDTLQLAGAQHIIVWNTPNVGLAPAILAGGSQTSGLATLLAGAMNDALTVRLGSEAGVKTFDLFGMQNMWAADPAAYGLDNVLDACGALGGACDPSKYLFWDGIHPTSAGHELTAQAMYALAVPEPGTYALLLVGLFVVVGVARRRSH